MGLQWSYLGTVVDIEKTVAKTKLKGKKCNISNYFPIIVPLETLTDISDVLKRVLLAQLAQLHCTFFQIRYFSKIIDNTGFVRGLSLAGKVSFI